MSSRRDFLRHFIVLSGVAGVSRCIAEPFGRGPTPAPLVSSTKNIVVSLDGPIKTLSEARDAARDQRASGRTGSITITIRTGVYHLPETLVLGPEDSDTIWEAARGEHPVISGGRVISGWSKAGSRVWTADAPAAYFTQLFVGGRRGARARTPNYGFLRMDGASSQNKPFQVRYRGNDIKPEWADRGDVDVVAFIAWSDVRMPIVKVDKETHLATLGSDPSTSSREMDARYFIENAPDALDAPGEWYLDETTQKVSYIPFPDEDMERAQVVAPALERLVSLEGNPDSDQLVRNVLFRGLTFAHAAWTMDAKGYFDMQAGLPAPSAIEAVGAEKFRVEHCTMTHCGGYGLFLGRGAKHNQVLASDFNDLGGGGIKVGEAKLSPNGADQNYDNLIADNDMHDLGAVYAAAVGVWVLESGYNQIVHNHIHDLYYTAISVGWTWGYGPNQCNHNIIAFNHLHSIGKDMLSDMGGIYTLGVQPGTVIRNNLIHDISSFTYGGWGIYPDEGSSYMLIENNIVYNCKSSGFHQHYGRENVVRNNVFAFNREFQLMRTRAESHLSFTMERNIVYFDQGGLLGSNWTDTGFTMRNNIYYDRRGPNISFARKSFAQWKALPQDQGSIIADPLFVNPDNYNFRLRPESPALKKGFQQIDMSTVGPRVRAGAGAW
jgi:parallel beta-helix repeat protein